MGIIYEHFFDRCCPSWTITRYGVNFYGFHANLIPTFSIGLFSKQGWNLRLIDMPITHDLLLYMQKMNKIIT